MSLNNRIVERAMKAADSTSSRRGFFSKLVGGVFVATAGLFAPKHLFAQGGGILCCGHTWPACEAKDWGSVFGDPATLCTSLKGAAAAACANSWCPCGGCDANCTCTPVGYFGSFECTARAFPCIMCYGVENCSQC